MHYARIHAVFRFHIITLHYTSKVGVVMNSTCIHLRDRGSNIYMYRRGRIYKEPPREIQ
jgi:hypothetical protein